MSWQGALAPNVVLAIMTSSHCGFLLFSYPAVPILILRATSHPTVSEDFAAAFRRAGGIASGSLCKRQCGEYVDEQAEDEYNLQRISREP